MQADVRRLRYRLKRQGMLELDAWLAPLDAAMQNSADAAVVAALQALLSCEPPELLMMMRGEKELPEVLRPWLG